MPEPAGAQPGALFPEPFRVEHHLVQEDGDGSLFVGESVVDTYGGSWIVSERADGSRLIVDLGRREITEVDPAGGRYWTIALGQLADLGARLTAAQGLPRTPRAAAAAGAGGGTSSEPRFEVRDVPLAAAASSSRGAAATRLEARARHLRVERAGEPAGAAYEIWVDPSIRMSAAAGAAVASFEAALHGGGEAQSPGAYLAAARAHTGGGVPVRTVRPMAASDGSPRGRVEDVATRLEKLDSFPSDLAAIPEGLTRVAHPLEAQVRFLEEEAARNAALAGIPPESN